MKKEYSVMIDGNEIAFEFKDSLIHAEGEHAGNIDAIITTSPPLPQNLLLDELHIKIPGFDEYLYIYGYGVVENSLKATFNSSSIIDTQQLPEIVEVYWGANGEQFIGEMCCQAFTQEAEAKIGLDENADDAAENNVVKEEKTVQKESGTKRRYTKKQRFIHIGVGLLLLVTAYFLIV